MNPFRIAVVGLGWAAQNRHLPALKRSSFALLGLIDQTPDRARTLAKNWRCRYHATASSLADVKWLNEVNAVAIAADPTAQFALTAEALNRGRHVLTETPFAMTVDEGVKLADMAKTSGRKFAIIHNLQFARSTRKLSADIASRSLGDIRGVGVTQLGHLFRPPREWRERLPFGSFYEASPQLLALLRAIVGPIALDRAQLVPAPNGLKTPARLEAWFKSDTADYPIHLSFDFESPSDEAYLVVRGTKAVGITDICRDFYYRTSPEEHGDAATGIPQMGTAVALQRWVRAATNRVPVLAGRATCGYDEAIFEFERGLFNKAGALEPIGPEVALAVLGLQHDIVRQAKTASATGEVN